MRQVPVNLTGCPSGRPPTVQILVARADVSVAAATYVAPAVQSLPVHCPRHMFAAVINPAPAAVQGAMATPLVLRANRTDQHRRMLMSWGRLLLADAFSIHAVASEKTGDMKESRHCIGFDAISG
eukprot:TRINITY_DN20595_c0_g1_i1.p2 TRINITY_DN20595_c0_g1~~TRINITY_DN20595_c0_g1_i1.p2  ORF type:complete len:125 (-),score=8.07 TRINITY_DN20595_c0_g1_i1:549-923(-)